MIVSIDLLKIALLILELFIIGMLGVCYKVLCRVLHRVIRIDNELAILIRGRAGERGKVDSDS